MLLIEQEEDLWEVEADLIPPTDLDANDIRHSKQTLVISQWPVYKILDALYSYSISSPLAC